MNSGADEVDQTDQGINWHTNTASELGAMLYELFGPFAHISPQRKFARCAPLTVRWRLDDPSAGTANHRAYASEAFVVRWLTGSIPMESRVVVRGNWNDCLLVGPSPSGGFSAAPTWRDLTNGTGKWTLAESLVIPPNATLSLDIQHPHDGLPDLVPRKQMQVVLHGFTLRAPGVLGWPGDVTKPLPMDAPAARLAYLEELIEEGLRRVKATTGN